MATHIQKRIVEQIAAISNMPGLSHSERVRLITETVLQPTATAGVVPAAVLDPPPVDWQLVKDAVSRMSDAEIRNMLEEVRAGVQW
jgi:hypothetical protein